MKKSLSAMGVSQDPSLPQANITNAPELFGDPEFGDFESGDAEETGDNLYGDGPEEGDAEMGDNLYGDPDMLSLFTSISGDPETGDTRVGRFIRANKGRIKKGALITGGVAGSALAARAIAKAIARRRSKAAINAKLSRAAVNQNIRKTAQVQSAVGRMHKASLVTFFSLKGAKLNSSPIDPLSKFVADMPKNMLDRQNMDTPFLQETAIGTFAAGTWTAQANGAATNRFYTGLILQIGTNVLNAAPGTVINVTGTFPTISGNLVIAATPFILTYESQYDVRFMFFPWQLVTNKALPVLGQYSNASPIIATITGIPAASAVNLVVPGSQHPWTVAMRNALIQ